MLLHERKSILSSDLESRGRTNFFCSIRVMAGEMHSCDKRCRNSRRSRRGGSRRGRKIWGFKLREVFPKEFPKFKPGNLKGNVYGGDRIGSTAEYRISSGQRLRQAA